MLFVVYHFMFIQQTTRDDQYDRLKIKIDSVDQNQR